MATILKVLHQIENLTLSIDAYLRKEQSGQISSKSDLKRQSLGFYEKTAPTRRRTTTQGKGKG